MLQLTLQAHVYGFVRFHILLLFIGQMLLLLLFTLHVDEPTASVVAFIILGGFLVFGTFYTVTFSLLPAPCP